MGEVTFDCSRPRLLFIIICSLYSKFFGLLNMGDGGNMRESTQLIRPIHGGKVTDGLSLPPHFPHIAPGGGGGGISLIGAL